MATRKSVVNIIIMSGLGSSGSETPSTNGSRGVSVSNPFGEKQAEVMEADKKKEAMDSLRSRQNMWNLMSKTKSDLESVKNRSLDEDEKLQQARKYLLVNVKPQMAGRKSRKHKKGSKKTRKHKKASRRR
jgi:hypothetical protein